jgi:Tol biopolymer transport system component
VAYAARKLQTEPYQVYVRDLDSRLPRQITHAKNSAVPIQWTTTGQIILMSAGEILSILEVGGEPERLLELRDAVVVAVSRDGSSLASYEADGEIHVRSPLTAEPQRYEPAPFEETRSDWLPQLAFSPEGTHLLLLTASAGWIMPYPADSKVPPRRILESLGVPASPISHRFSWLNDRHIIVQSASRGSTGSADLFVADTRSGKVSAVRPPGITSLTELAASPDGSKVVFQQRIIAHDIVNMSLEDATVTPYIATARNEEGPTWAAREPAMAYVTDRSGPSEIWLHEEGREDRPIVTGADFFGGPQMLGVPSLAPDGTRVIYFRAALEGAPQPGLYISAVAGGSPVLLAAVTGSVAGGSWSPDGNWFVYTEGTASGPKTLKKVRTSPRAEPEPLRSLSVLAPLAPRWSPQGDWILYGDGGLKLIAEDGGNVRELGFGAVCTFTRDGSHLYCLTPTGAEWRLRYLDLDGKIERDLGSVANEDSPRALFGNGLGLSMRPDGVNVTYAVQRSSENLSMLEGLDTVPLP